MKILNSRIGLSAAVAAMLTLSSPILQDASAQDGNRGQRGGQADGERQGRGGQADGQRGRRGGGDMQQGRRGGGQDGRRGGGGNWQRGGGGMMMGGFGQMMRPYYARRDMPIFVDELDLDESQRTIVEVLILDYETRFGESLDAMRDKMQSLRPQREEDPEMAAKRDELREQMGAQMEKFREMRRAAGEGQELDEETMNAMRDEMRAMREQMEELRPPRPSEDEIRTMVENFTDLYNDWRTERAVLEDEFISGVQVILNEEQQDNFAGFERTLRRNKTLTQGRLSGERVDLIREVKQINDIRTELDDMEDLLESYALELDNALVARNTYSEESRSTMGRSFANQDFGTILDAMEKESAYRIAVRDVNRTYAEIIGVALGDMFNEDIKNEFDAAWRNAAYPQVYRPSYVTRSFETIYEWEDFDPELLEAIRVIEEAYNAERGTMNDRLVSITIQEEPSRTTRFVESRIARMNGEDIEQPADPIRELEGERRELDTRYREQIEALLTPEQIEELPQARGNRGNRGGWGNAGDREAMRARMIEQYDKDGDGELSEEERAAARDAWRNQMRRNNNDDEI